MVTLVGLQTDVVDAIQDLIELDYDAVEAYQAAINRLDNQVYKIQLRQFMADHERHIQELSTVLRRHSEEVPEGPSIGKQWLTKGKVVIANLMGDNAILLAMRSNEVDTNKAYERMSKRADLPVDISNIIARGLEDERRHKAWLESIINA
jgi:rubrerythrin